MIMAVHVHMLHNRSLLDVKSSSCQCRPTSQGSSQAHGIFDFSCCGGKQIDVIKDVNLPLCTWQTWEEESSVICPQLESVHDSHSSAEDDVLRQWAFSSPRTIIISVQEILRAKKDVQDLCSCAKFMEFQNLAGRIQLCSHCVVLRKLMPLKYASS
jgi:hypothetical protein